MERRRQKGSALQQRSLSRAAAGPAPKASSFSLLNLHESLGNQGLLSLLATDRLQPKLAVNQPGDVYEQEADRVAEGVVSSPASPAVQRKPAGEAGPVTAPPVIHAVLGSAGQPLDPAARAFLEPDFGHSFGDVRVHTGERAAEAARSVDALAFTVGRNLVFGGGQYAPGTTEGRRLLAHELTHVVQQQAAAGASLQRKEGDKEKPPKMKPSSGVEELYKFFVNTLAAGWISADEVDLLLQTLHGLRLNAAILLNPKRYLENYLDEKAAEIKYYARQGDEAGLHASFRDFYGLYALLVHLLFDEDLGAGVQRLWQLANEPDILPGITDPDNPPVTDTRTSASITPGASQNPAAGKNKGPTDESGSITKMVTEVAEKAYQVFEDLSQFSIEFPIVIQAANVIVKDFKAITVKKLTTKLVVLEGRGKATVLNTDLLTWSDLFRIWFWEMGPESLKELSFGQNALTTKDVMNLVGTRGVVAEAWNQVLAGKELKNFKRQVHYNPPEFFNSLKNRNKAFNFLGTYTVVVTFEQPAQGAKSVKAIFTATNDPSLESFSRLRKAGRPDGVHGFILKNREREDPGVKIGSTLKAKWVWHEELPTSLIPPEKAEIKALSQDNLRTKPPLTLPGHGK